MPLYGSNNPYGDGGLGGSYAFGKDGPTNIFGIPVAYSGPSADSLKGSGLPVNADPNVYKNLGADAQAEDPFLGQEQQLVNQMQNLDPNASVGAALWGNQALGDKWSQQAMAQQQSAYDLAKSYAGGADTAAYKQMLGSQGTGNAMAQGSALGAGGGARGAAAAQGALQDSAGATNDMQRAAREQQKAQDIQNYTAEAAKLGNQLYGSQLGYQQGVASWQNSQGQLQGQYQQLADQASLGAGTMMSGVLAQNYGLAQNSAQQYLQQQEQSGQQQQQLWGAGMSAIGSGASQWGRGSGSSGGGGGGGSGDGSSPYGLGNNAENPWWNT